MAGAKVRWDLAAEVFEVDGRGEVWLDDTDRIIGSLSVIEHASLTAFRRAISRYRATVDDVEMELRIYDVPPEVLEEESDDLSPREVSIEFAHHHTFVSVEIFVELHERFDRFELIQVLSPLLAKFRAKVIQLNHDDHRLFTAARLTIEIPVRGRTVGEALDFGSDVERLWLTSMGQSLGPGSAADLVRAGRAELLVGQPEGPWFEAKQASYDTKNPLARFELAKDVAAMANSRRGGLIVIGLKTTKLNGVDVVHSIRPQPKAGLRPHPFRQVLDKHVYPIPVDLAIEYAEAGPNSGLLLILIPPQPLELLPFLTVGAVAENKLLGNHFSLVTRREDHTVATDVASVHGAIAAGRVALAMLADQNAD